MGRDAREVKHPVAGDSHAVVEGIRIPNGVCRFALCSRRAQRILLWLTYSEGRRYWEWILDHGIGLNEDALACVQAYPFRQGLYQRMRNRVLADLLARNTEAEWADFTVSP